MWAQVRSIFIPSYSRVIRVVRVIEREEYDEKNRLSLYRRLKSCTGLVVVVSSYWGLIAQDKDCKRVN